MRSLTKGFVTPDGGCNTFRASLAGLEELEADLHEHVHLESNVLFPRALQLIAMV
jgi:regulator of cell morphogenesis and NO signaling